MNFYSDSTIIIRLIASSSQSIIKRGPNIGLFSNSNTLLRVLQSYILLPYSISSILSLSITLWNLNQYPLQSRINIYVCSMFRLNLQINILRLWINQLFCTYLICFPIISSLNIVVASIYTIYYQIEWKMLSYSLQKGQAIRQQYPIIMSSLIKMPSVSVSRRIRLYTQLK